MSGSVASLYAVDGNAYVKSTTTEAGSGNQVASFTGAFRIPAGTPSALLHAAVSTNLAGCLFQVYLTNASGANIAGGQAAPSGNAGTVEIAISGSLLAQYRDPASGLTQIVLRMYRPPSAGSGTVTWSTDQMAVLLPILPDSGQEYEGTYQSGSLASLFAVDANAYVKTTQIEGSTNNQVASFATTFKIPDGTTSAILHAVSAASLDGSRLQAYTIVASPNDAVILGGAPLASAMLPFDFPLTATDLARRNATTGELAIDLRTFRPPSAGTGAVTWSTDQLVMYAEPAPGPAMPTGLTATAVSTYEIDLSWTNNETGYKIERKTGANGTYAQIGTAPANAVTYQDASGLSASTTYVYRVRATNADGNSPYSNEASATTNSLPVIPAYLKQVTLAKGWVKTNETVQGTISLSKPRSTATVVSLQSESHLSVPSQVTIPANQPSATFTATGQYASEPISCRIIARTPERACVCDVSVVASSGFGTLDVQAEAGANCVLLTWKPLDPADLGGLISGYQVFRRVPGGQAQLLNASGFGRSGQYIDLTGSLGANYEYSVTLVDSGGVVLSQSPYVSVTYPSGSGLTWSQSPTLQGSVIRGSADTGESNPLGGLFVNGFKYGNASAKNPYSSSSATILSGSADPIDLPNGSASFVLAYYGSSSIKATPAANVSVTSRSKGEVLDDYLPEDGGDVSLVHVSDSSSNTSPKQWSVTIKDASGNTIRTFSGEGDTADVAWDGKYSDGSDAPRADYFASASFSDGYSYQWRQRVIKTFRQFDGIFMVGKTENDSQAIIDEYVSFIRARMEIRKQNFPNYRYVVIPTLATSDDDTPGNLGTRMREVIRGSFGSTLQDFYVYGHAGPRNIEIGGITFEPDAPVVNGHRAAVADLKNPLGYLTVNYALNGRTPNSVYLDGCDTAVTTD